jgi:ribose transport system substrate-binding protein
VEQEHDMADILNPNVRLSRRELLDQASKYALAAGLAGPVGSFLMACGGGAAQTGGASTAISSAALSELSAEISAARSVSKFKAPAPAFNGKAGAGKRVFYLSIDQSIPIVQFLWQNLNEALLAANLKPILYDGKSQQNLYVSGMEAAIAQKVDVLLIESISTNSLAAQIQAARSAGIKVIDLNELVPQVPVDAGVHLDYLGAAQLEADWVINDSQGKGINAVVLRAPHPTHTAMGQQIKQRFDKYVGAGNYTYREQIIDFGDWQTRLPSIVSTLMIQDPKINYIIPVVDGMSLFIAPALHQSGHADKVKISTFNGTQGVLKLLKSHDVVWQDNGQDTVYTSWAYADQSLRLITGQSPVADYKIPNRLFDRTNIDQIDINDPHAWFDDNATKAGFKQLWGV